MLLVSDKMVSLGSITMCNYVETRKGISSYNLVCNFFVIAFAIKKLSSCGTLFESILAGNETFQKHGF